MSEKKSRLETRWNYEWRDPTASLDELLKVQSASLDIPRRCLYGIQTRFEYETAKRKRVESDYAKHGAEILLQHPVHAVALPIKKGDLESYRDELVMGIPYAITILDGHHRVRYAPRQVREIHTLVLTLAQGLAVYKRRYGDDMEAFIKQVQGEKNEALHSFASNNPLLTPYDAYFLMSQTNPSASPLVGIVGRNGKLSPIV